MILDWIKCKGEIWCELFKLDLDHKLLDINGVFLIFTEENANGTVLIGSGNIQDILRKASKDPAVAAFQSHGCFVTWAKAGVLTQSGIVSYLISKLQPKLNSKSPKSIPISVNLPWE